MLRSLGATSSRDIGLVPPYSQWEKLFGGLLLGFLTLVVAAAIAVICGDRAFATTMTAPKSWRPFVARRRRRRWSAREKRVAAF